MTFTVVLGCLMLGFVLLGIELFVLPGFGVVGIVGTAMIVVGILLAFWHRGPAEGMALLGGATVLTVAMGIVARRVMSRRLVLDDRLVEPQAPHPDLSALRGRRGMAISQLRPAGIARFGEQRVDVVTDGEFLPAGTTVVVVSVEGNRVLVEAEASESAGTGAAS